ncbi:MAG: MFS transporter [Pseudomonadota bacterium]
MDKAPPTHERSLISQRRFGPFFGTQALGAFNDNVFKQALIILITYQGLSLWGLDSGKLVNLAAVVFILPFFLLSATAGQLADRFQKAMLIRYIKAFEIGVMCLAGLALWMNSVPFLLLVLFLAGAQSSFFGPVKYAILPQVLSTEELVKGNGQVSMGTFVAILLGSLTGGALIAIDGVGWQLVVVVLLIVATLGYGFSRKIPDVPVADPNLKIDPNLFRQTARMLGHARENLVVFRSILGVSWFWFFGSVMLAQLPPLVRDVLGGNESVAILVFTLFSLGIGTGSILCDKLSARRVEIGLVPLGAFGLSAFGLDLYFAAGTLAASADVTALAGVGEFLARPGAKRFVADVLLIGTAGGFYIVPLLALIQHRSEPDKRSRVIAGGNVLNALLMVLAGIYSIAALSLGLDVTQLIALTAVLNAVVALYIFTLVPEFLLRCAAWVLVRTLYRVRLNDMDRIPADGPVLLVCNHVSYVDALVIGGSVPRPVRFVMYYKIFRWPMLGWLFRAAKTIPIAGAKENPEVLDAAFDRIDTELADGQVVCIFPEGALTDDGEVATFRKGVERILKRRPVPVVPMALDGLWGSYFSHSDGGAFRGPWRKLFSRVRLRTGELVAASEATADGLRERVLKLIRTSAD